MLNSHYVMFIYMIHDTYFRLVAQNLIKHYVLLLDKAEPCLSQLYEGTDHEKQTLVFI